MSRSSTPSRGDQADVAVLDFAGERIEVLRTAYRVMAFPRHTHEYYAIGVGLCGVGSIWYRGESHVRRRGDIVIIPPGEVHTGGVGPCKGVLSYLAACVPVSIVETCARAEGIRVESIDVRAPVLRDSSAAEALRTLGAILPLSNQNGDAATAAAQDALALALSRLIRRHARAESTRRGHGDSALVRTTRDIIQSCYADPTRTSLDALAAATGVTAFHVARAFTQAVGVSPHQYLLQVRVERARMLLAAGMSPSLVAAMTGFVDQSHLTIRFKRYLGITPGRYQRCLGV